MRRQRGACSRTFFRPAGSRLPLRPGPARELVERLDQPLGLVARGRSALYNGKTEEALLLLNQVKRLKPDFPEAILLEGEILIKEGRIDEARQLLTVLASDLGTSDWIRAEAEAILNSLP